MHSMSNWFLLPANTAWYAWGCRCRALPRWYVLGGNLAVSSNAVHSGCRDFLRAGRLHSADRMPSRPCVSRQGSRHAKPHGRQGGRLLAAAIA